MFRIITALAMKAKIFMLEHMFLMPGVSPSYKAENRLALEDNMNEDKRKRSGSMNAKRIIESENNELGSEVKDWLQMVDDLEAQPIAVERFEVGAELGKLHQPVVTYKIFTKRQVEIMRESGVQRGEVVCY